MPFLSRSWNYRCGRGVTCLRSGRLCWSTDRPPSSVTASGRNAAFGCDRFKTEERSGRVRRFWSCFDSALLQRTCDRFRNDCGFRPGFSAKRQNSFIIAGTNRLYFKTALPTAEVTAASRYGTEGRGNRYVSDMLVRKKQRNVLTWTFFEPLAAHNVAAHLRAVHESH